MEHEKLNTGKPANIDLGDVSGSVNINKLQWKCFHCGAITDEYEAITDINGMERCPKCNTVYGGSPKHYR